VILVRNKPLLFKPLEFEVLLVYFFIAVGKYPRQATYEEKRLIYFIVVEATSSRLDVPTGSVSARA
jgi:hypothetical protein